MKIEVIVRCCTADSGTAYRRPGSHCREPRVVAEMNVAQRDPVRAAKAGRSRSRDRFLRMDVIAASACLASTGGLSHAVARVATGMRPSVLPLMGSSWPTSSGRGTVHRACAWCCRAGRDVQSADAVWSVVIRRAAWIAVRAWMASRFCATDPGTGPTGSSVVIRYRSR